MLLGSVIVEAIVTWGLSFLTHMMAEINLKVSNSYSPGYLRLGCGGATNVFFRCCLMAFVGSH